MIDSCTTSYLNVYLLCQHDLAALIPFTPTIPVEGHPQRDFLFFNHFFPYLRSMHGLYHSVRKPPSLFDHCNPTEFQQDNTFFHQPLLLGEALNYVDPSRQYYGTHHYPPDRESLARVGGPTAEVYGIDAHTLDSPIATNDTRESWRHHGLLPSQDQLLRLEPQRSPTRYLDAGFRDLTQPPFEDPYKMTASSEMESFKEDVTSCSTSPKVESSPAMDMWPLLPEEPATTFASEDDLIAKDSQDDEETSGDKPYARLIHEALMQAPGHRMMLREIYDWFVQNTTKPRESGTNGWQNSIRHNLSMNQVRCTTVKLQKLPKRAYAWSRLLRTIGQIQPILDNRLGKPTASGYSPRMP
jgi:Forkhead domain